MDTEKLTEIAYKLRDFLNRHFDIYEFGIEECLDAIASEIGFNDWSHLETSYNLITTIDKINNGKD
jgi:hypothetical protein